ncbi:MAG: hypothetical protein ACFNPW_02815 [Candidatus Nanosyncoccus sp.]
MAGKKKVFLKKQKQKDVNNEVLGFDGRKKVACAYFFMALSL